MPVVVLNSPFAPTPTDTTANFPQQNSHAIIHAGSNSVTAVKRIYTSTRLFGEMHMPQQHFKQWKSVPSVAGKANIPQPSVVTSYAAGSGIQGDTSKQLPSIVEVRTELRTLRASSNTCSHRHRPLQASNTVLESQILPLPPTHWVSREQPKVWKRAVLS